MHKKRKLLSLILAAAMVLSLLPASALAEEADAVSSMEETDGAPGAPSEPKLITAWAPLDEPAIQVEPGITEPSLGLPEVLTATVDGSDAAVAVTWTSEPEYDPDAEGVYVFTPVPEEGYATAEGAEPPAVSVTVASSGQDADDSMALMEAGSDVTVSSWADFKTALAQSGTFTITLGDNLTATDDADLCSDAASNVTIDGKGHTITKASNWTYPEGQENFYPGLINLGSTSSLTTLTLKDIIIDGGGTAGSSSHTSSLVRVKTGSADHIINLQSGTTLQNLVVDTGGGAIVSYVGTINMENGVTIQGINAKDQTATTVGIVGAIMLIGTLNMRGGIIRDCKLGARERAAAIYVEGSKGGVFNMTGGTITGNTKASGSTSSAGVYDNGGIKLSGTAYIYDNTKGGAQSNVYIMEGKKIDVGSGFSDGAKVGVYTEATVSEGNPVVFATANDEETAQSAVPYFLSDKPTSAGVMSSGTDIKLDYAARGYAIQLTQPSSANFSVSGGALVQYGINDTSSYQAVKLTPTAGYTMPTAWSACPNELLYTYDSTDGTATITCQAVPTGNVTAALPAAEPPAAPTVAVAEQSATGSGLSERVTATLTVTDPVQGVQYQYSVDGGTTWQNATLTEGKFTVSGLRYGDHIQVRAGVGTAAMVRVLDTALRNGGFETISAPDGGDELRSDQVYAWHTTASDGKIEIYSHRTYGVSTLEGLFCAELNAHQDASLYQEISTVPGAGFGWSLNHSGRMGADIMALVIGPATEDSYQKAAVGDQDLFQKIVASMDADDKVPGKTTDVTYGGSTYSVTIIRDGKGWKEYHADYTIPADQTETVFGFTSISAAGGNKALGNLLDGIAFEKSPIVLTSGVDAQTGRGEIKITNPAADGKYSLLKPNGEPMTKADLDALGITAVDGAGNPVAPDNDGTFTWGAGKTGPLAYSVPAGSAYTVQVDYGAEGKKTKDTTVPAVGDQQVSAVIKGEGADKKASLTIAPADAAMQYAVVKKSDSSVTAPWSAGGETSVNFDGLDPNEEYVVVARPKSSADSPAPTDQLGTGVTVKTPEEGFTNVTSDSVSRDHGTDPSKDKIVIGPSTVSGQEYAVVDKATGQVVDAAITGDASQSGGWATSSGGEITFDGLDPEKDYEVVTRTPGTPPSIPGPGVSVPAATVKPGDVSNGTDENGKASITVADTDPDTKYAVVDSQGNVIAPSGSDKDGWISGNQDGGPITFPGLNAGDDYKVVTVPKETGDTDPTEGGNDKGAFYPENVLTPDDLGLVGPAVKVPAVSEDQLSAGITGEDPNQKANITVSPADKDLSYGLVTKDEHGNFIEVTPAGDWKPGTGGTVSFDGLDPNKEYVVVAKPTTGDGSSASTTDKGGSGTSVKTPAKDFADVAPDSVSRDDGAAEGKDKIVLKPTKTGQEYAVIDKTTGQAVKDENGQPIWKTGTGDTPLEFDGLTPGKDYEVVTRTPGTPASLPGKGVEVPGSTVKDGDVSNGTDASGKASITVDKTDPNTKYAIVDQNTGKVVAPMGGDLDGWLTGNNGKLEFPGLNAGGDYKVVTVPKDEADTDASGQGGNAADSLYPAGIEDTGKDSSIQNVAGPVKKLPTVSADQLSGGVVKDGEGHDKAQITIQPTDDELYYAVVDSTGAVVGGVDGWQSGSKTGPITFSPLNPNETYEVVALPKKDAPDPLPTNGQKDKGTKVHTPAGEQVAAESVTRVTETDGPNQGKDTINLQPTKDTLEYAVVDKVTGKVVTDEHGEPIWKPGTGADSAVSFGGLDPKREYEVVTRPVVDDGSLSVANQPGLTVKKVGALELTGKVYGPDGTTPVKGAEVAVVVATVDGGYQTLTATTGADGTYTLKAEGVALDQAYAVYVKSGAGVASSAQTFSKTQPQVLGDITVEKAASGNTNITGGAVSAFGKPVAGQAVTIRDKATGEIVAPVSGVTTTTAGGGYTVENLPDGTYIVETSGGGKSGMTEIVVKNGEAVANKAGGYSSANVAAVPGGIVKGNVSGLKAGEKATVSLNVPLYDADGTTVIGTQTVTAQAEGTGGYWQIAGVPAGSYPVTVATPNGTVTGTAAIGADGSVSAVTPGEGVTGTDIKAEGGKLAVATPEVKPEKPNVITGAVVNGQNEPVTNATVTIYNDKGEKVGSATTGTGGGYTVPNDLPDGKYYISTDSADGKNGLTGPIEIKNGQTEGKTTVKVAASTGKLLEGTVTKEGSTPEKPLPAAGATVVVKDAAGNVLATAKTDANGQYFLGSVPDGAVVSIVTADGETKSFTVGTTTADGAWDGTQTTAKPANAKPVIGPNGAKLPISLTAESGKAAVTVTGPSPAVDNVNGKFEVDASGDLAAKTDSNKASDGTYTVTVAQNGMEVTSTVTVKNGLIADSAPIKIAPHTVSGTIQYAEGSKPSDAVISIPGWGSAKVNTNTGKYELSNIPDGTYTATIQVTDSGKSPDVTSTIQVTIKVENGAASYENTVADSNTGASVTVSGTNLTVTPTKAVEDIQTAVSGAQSAIDAAKAAPADRAKLQAAITQVKAAQDAIAAASEEELKQLDSAAAGKLAQALTDLLAGSLDVDASAEGVQNALAAKDSLEAQKGLLVEQDELESAAKTGTSVDVTLTLKANDVTDEPTSTVNKDLPKVNAIASATGAEKTGLYEVVVEKTTVVKELPAQGAEKVVSETTTTVPQLPVPVTLTLAIPADLLGFQYYAVVRVHNGTAQRIPSTATKNTVTFTSSLYSTFAILGSNDVIFDDDAKVEDGGNQGGSTGTGGGGGSSAGGSVTVGKTDGGKLTLSPTNPKEGDKVTITVKPDEGYTLDKLVIKDSKGNEIKYVDNGDGTYTYTQPKRKVAISAAFHKVTGDPHDNGVDRLLTVDDHIAFMQGDPSGSFRPAGSITRAEVAQLFYNLLKDKNVTSDKAFTDVAADAWYAKAVAALAGLGIVNGVGDGAFAPDRTITRAEFATIATRFALRTSGAVAFTDVRADHWAYDAIGMAACYGWINGYEDGSFQPDAPITRSEAAKVVNTMLGRSADKSFIDKAEGLKLFPDVPATNWAFYEIAEAANAHEFTVTDGVESWGK